MLEKEINELEEVKQLTAELVSSIAEALHTSEYSKEFMAAVAAEFHKVAESVAKLCV